MTNATGAPVARDVNEARAHLSEYGVTVLENVLDADGVARVKKALMEGVAADRANGVQLHGFVFDPDEKNTRVFDLIGKSRVFRDLVTHDVALDLARHVIGQEMLLSNFSANITAPGSGPMGMHADQGYVPAPWPPYPLAVNVAWALDDFTIENGATRFVPNTHTKDHGPDKDAHRAGVPIVCKAGSIFVMDGRVWHETGSNVSAAATRAGLFAYYVRPFLRPQWNWYLTIPDHILEEASPTLRALLGFGENPTGRLSSLYLKERRGDPLPA